MASTEGLVPITRAYLSSYYDKYPFVPLSDDVATLTSDIRSLITDLQTHTPLTQDESVLVDEVDAQPPHKIDENMWKNREHLEEIIFLLDRPHWPNTLQQQSKLGDVELAPIFEEMKVKFENTLKLLEYFQSKNADNVFNTGFVFLSNKKKRRHIAMNGGRGNGDGEVSGIRLPLSQDCNHLKYRRNS